MITSTNGELVRWAFEEVLNNHDVTPLAESFWTDTTPEQRFPDRTCRGRAEIVPYFEQVFAALPDFHMRILTLVEDGPDVFVHWRMTGTHTGGTFQGIDATGKPIDIQGMDHFVFSGPGKLESNTIIFDQLTFARQVGFVPPDRGPADRAAKAAFNAKNRLAARLRRRG